MTRKKAGEKRRKELAHFTSVSSNSSLLLLFYFAFVCVSPALKKANVGIAVHGCTDAARAAAAIVLLRPGLSTICDAVTTSRAIFQRMQSYSLYRITSTIHFLLFLFCSILIFDFTIPAVLIVLITVMNDAATLVISVDNAQISRQPDKWRLGQLIFLSFLLASLLTASSFAHFLVFRSLHYSIAHLGTILYLQMSSSPHFVIFSTRIPGPWYSNMPGLRFSAAILGTTIRGPSVCSVRSGVGAGRVGGEWSGDGHQLGVLHAAGRGEVCCVPVVESGQHVVDVAESQQTGAGEGEAGGAGAKAASERAGATDQTSDARGVVLEAAERGEVGRSGGGRWRWREEERGEGSGREEGAGVGRSPISRRLCGNGAARMG